MATSFNQAFQYVSNSAACPDIVTRPTKEGTCLQAHTLAAACSHSACHDRHLAVEAWMLGLQQHSDERYTPHHCAACMYS